MHCLDDNNIVSLPGVSLCCQFSAKISHAYKHKDDQKMLRPDIFIRRLTADDAAAFKRLRLAAIADTPTAVWAKAEEEAMRSTAEVQARIEPAAHQAVFGAFIETRLVAIAGLRRESLAQLSHKATLWGVFVHPECRKEGIAKKLLMHIKGYAREMGVLQILLSVSSENHRAKNLYESLGFEPFGLEPRSMKVGPKFYDEVHMCLRLDH